MTQPENPLAAGDDARAAHDKFCAARDAELVAMAEAFNAIAVLDSNDARRRVIRWLGDAAFMPDSYSEECPF